ncbi:MAG: hypothetical protein MIO92_13375 [Methanosarcinaceae archaeon]|jgi:hypothetical protein|nr:hypothetical protein [Methanosarcinaceae archaeon]
MRLIQTTIIILVAVTVWLFVTDGAVFHISRVLPFCSGDDIDWRYEAGGLIMICLFLWGLYRLRRNGRQDDQP